MTDNSKKIKIAVGSLLGIGALFFLIRQHQSWDNVENKKISQNGLEPQVADSERTNKDTSAASASAAAVPVPEPVRDKWSLPNKVDGGKDEGCIEEIVACISRACKIHANIDTKVTDAIELNVFKDLVKEDRTAVHILQESWTHIHEVVTCNDLVCYFLKVKCDFGQVQLNTHLCAFENKINMFESNTPTNIAVRRAGRRSIGGSVTNTTGSGIADLPSSWVPILATRVASIFRRLDMNGDHCIDKEEILELHGGDRATTESMFADLDTNHDGTISPQEFVEYFFRVLKRHRGKTAESSLSKGQKLVGKIVSILEGKLKDRDERIAVKSNV